MDFRETWRRFAVVLGSRLWRYYVMSGTSGDDAIKEVRRGLHPNHSNPTRRFAKETTSAGARRNLRRDDSGERESGCVIVSEKTSVDMKCT